MPTHTSLVARFFKLQDMANATTCLMAHLPDLDLTEIPPQQRQGLINSIEKLHSEIHNFKQRVAALEAQTKN